MFSVRMHKILVAGFAFGIAMCMAQSACADDVARADESYIAEKNGASIVLNGVRHGSGMAAPSAEIRRYFDKSTVLMTEFDFTDRRRTAKASEELRHGKTLAISRFLNADELNVIHSAWMKKLGGKASMSAQTLGELNACGFNMYLLPSDRSPAPAGNTSQHYAWEEIFLPEAKARGKTVVELEPDGSMHFCEQMTADQVRALVLGAARLQLDDKAREGYLRYAALSNESFRSGDGAAGYAHSLEALDFDASYKSAFIHYMAMRNKAMSEVIEQQHARLPPGGYAFLMVGNLHLHGDSGLLALLQTKGFRVTRL